MGVLAPRTIFANDTGPLTGAGLDDLAKNQAAILELEGAQAPQSKKISNGSISPTSAYVIVDTEGSAAADDLTAISNVLSASENLHDGMVIYLKAADSGRVVTVKNSTSPNGINTYDGNDYALSPTHWLKLQLRSGKWYEVEGRAMEKALAAVIAAAAASTAADHATTKSGTSSTASGTAAKVVTCSVFELSDQARVVVTFSNANTVADALTLNVNGTGAKSIYNQTGIISTTNTALFAANQPIEFRYDGTGWVFYDATKAVSSGSFLASSSTAAGTAAKVADCAGFTLSVPSRVFVTFANTNTVGGALTLNVNGTGAKPIYNDLGATSASNFGPLPSGVPIEFIFDGTNWRYKTCDIGNTILQEVRYETGAYASSSASIPMDDTIPQITEGTQVMSASITPKSASSKITIDVLMFISGNGSNHSMAALFKDLASDAIETCLVTTSGTNYGLPIVMKKTLTLGDTSPHTFTVRIGPYSGTMYMNGNSAGRLFGGTFISSITIKERVA